MKIDIELVLHVNSNHIFMLSGTAVVLNNQWFGSIDLKKEFSMNMGTLFGLINGMLHAP